MQSVLIANRGEIAVRIIRAASMLGLRTIAVATPSEAQALHVREADAAVQLRGEGPSAYLDVPDLLRAAQESGAQLVHPGYGFLSEDAEFSRACADAGLAFAGPDPATLEVLGDKTEARAFAEAHGVPVLAGTGIVSDLDDAVAFMATLGGPCMVKAVGGGGGRGMRVVQNASDLATALDRAASEAQRGFGRGEVYLEEYIARSRHVEVQVVGDGTGAAVHAWTRDCTLQRRHQKVIEIAPAPGVSPKAEAQMLEAAVRLARALKVRGLVTFEFLIDSDRPERFAFIEANPRLQVEHGITEQVTGLDLVCLQLSIARGETLQSLGLDQRAIRAPQGIAVEARVSIRGDDRPSDAIIESMVLPRGAGIRVDAGVVTGDRVHVGFDPLIAKVMLHEASGDLRAAMRRLADSLEAFQITGPRTNLPDLVKLLRRPEVLDGEITTSLLDSLATTTASDDDDGALPVPSPVGGTVIAVVARSSETVRRGQPLAVVESMKMEHDVVAPAAGTLEGLTLTVGAQVRSGEVLARVLVDPRADTPESASSARLWEPDHIRSDLAEHRRRHALTGDSARADAVAKRHAQGRRTARENIADLIDPATFTEHGALVIAAQRRRRAIEDLERTTPADGLVCGFGTLRGDQRSAGREVAVLAYDATVLAGTQGLQSHKKAERMFDLARRRGTPVVVFAEGGGGRPGDTDNAAKATGMDLGTFASFGRLSESVPTVAIAAGRCFAGNAALFGAADVSIATHDANIGMGGPAMIEGGGLGIVAADEIGPAPTLAEVGVVDVLVKDEAEAVAAAKRYLGFFAGRTADWSCADQRELRHLVPERRARSFDMRRLIEVLVDDDSALELRKSFGHTVITTLARIEGIPVGVIANDARHLGGAIDVEGADSMARFLELCNGSGIPVITLVDTPGFMVGPDSEALGAVRRFGRLFTIGPNLSVPLCTVVVRKSYGLGGQAMAGGSFRVPDLIVSWPTGTFGAMGPEGAVRLGFKKELDAVEDERAREAEFRRLVAEYERDGSAWNAASVFELDDVIDPADTRAALLSVLAPEGGRSVRSRRV